MPLATGAALALALALANANAKIKMFNATAASYGWMISGESC